MQSPASSALSRRNFLAGAGATTLIYATPSLARAAQAASAQKLIAFVGTSTGAPGAGSNGEGIYAFDVDAANAERLCVGRPDACRSVNILERLPSRNGRGGSFGGLFYGRFWLVRTGCERERYKDDE